MTKAELVAQNEALSNRAESYLITVERLEETATALYEAASTLGDFNAALQKSLVDEQEKYEKLADQVHVLTLREKDAILVSTLRVKLILSLAKEITELDQDLQHARMQIDAANDANQELKDAIFDSGYHLEKGMHTGAKWSVCSGNYSSQHRHSPSNDGMRYGFGGHKH